MNMGHDKIHMNTGHRTGLVITQYILCPIMLRLSFTVVCCPVYVLSCARVCPVLCPCMSCPVPVYVLSCARVCPVLCPCMSCARVCPVLCPCMSCARVCPVLCPCMSCPVPVYVLSCACHALCPCMSCPVPVYVMPCARVCDVLCAHLGPVARMS